MESPEPKERAWPLPASLKESPKGDETPSFQRTEKPLIPLIPRHFTDRAARWGY